MKIIRLFGELVDLDLENLNKNRPFDICINELVYAYHEGNYEGHGVAAYRDNKGMWHLDEISHCSCYGALDGGFNKIGYTNVQILGLLKKRIEDNWLKSDYMLVLNEVEKIIGQAS